MNSAIAKKWKLKSGLATIDWEGHQFQVDTKEPAKGIEFRSPAGTGGEFLLATPQVVTQKNERIDPFLRGSDLIAAYPCNENRLIGGELGWRARVGWEDDQLVETETDSDQESVKEVPFSIELLYSIQTDLLDSQPNPQVNSLLRGESIQFFEMGNGKQLQPCSQDGQITACMIKRSAEFVLITLMPSDLVSFRLGIEKRSDEIREFNIVWDLALDFLEKGVIRRMRMFFAIGEDPGQLIQTANRFFLSDLPLTA